jgi:hypothetical protein
MQPTLRRAAAALLGATVLAGSIATTVAAVDPEPSDLHVFLNAPNGLEEHHPFSLTVQVNTLSSDSQTDATLDFDEADSLGQECHDVPVAGNECSIDNPAGTYHYVVTYSGNAQTQGSVSAPMEIVVTPDTLDADSVGLTPSTFYPVKDGYRDTVTISGNRQEEITVTISVYNGANKRVHLASVSQASGSYAHKWNGRNSKGDILPAGKYRVVQKLIDAFGTTKSFTSYVNLSLKKLVTLSKVITKDGSAITAGGGNLAKSGGALRMKGSGARAGWQFKIPSALIYKSLTFRVSAAAHLAAPPSFIGIQNFNICSDWDADCFDRLKGIGSSSGARKWYSTSGSPSSHRKGLVVRGLVYVSTGTVWVYKAEIKVTYQVLK